MSFIIGIVILLAVLGLVVWAGRTKESTGNGDNVTAARRYGASGHG